MSIFKRVVEYVAAFDPKFPRAIAGASPEQIAELESLLGRPAPEIYRDFLGVMGRSMDWIRIRKMDLSIGTVLAYYRRENWLPANRFIRIGDEHQEPRLNPYLMIDWPPDEPQVVCLPPFREQEYQAAVSSALDPLAGSLQEFVAMQAFRTLELRAEGRVPAVLREAGWRAGAIDQVDEVLIGLGFERLWFSSATGRAYRSHAAIVETLEHVGYPLQVFVSAAEPRDRQRLSRELLRRVPELRPLG